ncbi:hypothetical protein CROQUDRAFT_98067 [Cronartium quercuum f. sp. fusiforme G11]|uniref:Uncharacterized protein n=1 Tax=Cronartium quercuum f. sp. fusiforme G11 TaxID=708437 RepID=A0A9P6T8Z6_9BASI|nr:hypothetical protein CROQUDRAFT_98067 [Cronartium quercuum f. sp. fusiforme G11]
MLIVAAAAPPPSSAVKDPPVKVMLWIVQLDNPPSRPHSPSGTSTPLTSASIPLPHSLDPATSLPTWNLRRKEWRLDWMLLARWVGGLMMVSTGFERDTDAWSPGLSRFPRPTITRHIRLVYILSNFCRRLKP